LPVFFTLKPELHLADVTQRRPRDATLGILPLTLTDVHSHFSTRPKISNLIGSSRSRLLGKGSIHTKPRQKTQPFADPPSFRKTSKDSGDRRYNRASKTSSPTAPLPDTPIRSSAG